ncbi:MAG: FAD-binding oxidoreductase [Candidatus Helarchaeota archaeon]
MENMKNEFEKNDIFEKNLKQELQKIVDNENVIDNPNKIKEILIDYSFFPKRYPQYVVFPQNLHEIQKIIQLANKYNVPIIPRSSEISFYGESLHRQGGIMLNLKKMNKILDINQRNRSIRIQAGVNWGMIIEILKEHGLRLNMPLFPHPKKSVLTSYLERYPLVIATYEYSEPLGALEVVMGNGTIFRTGSAVGPGKPDEAPETVAFVDPTGPGSSDFYRIIQGAQGTICAVTWGTIKVETIPSLQSLYFISCEKLETLVDFIYKIQRRMIGYECLVLNSIDLAIILSQHLSQEFKKIVKELAPWNLIFIIGGLKRYPEEKIAYEEEILFELAKQVKLSPQKELPGIIYANQEILKIIGEAWKKEPYWKFFLKGACCDIFFLTTMNKVPEFDREVRKKTQQFNYPDDLLGSYMQPIEYGRACHLEYNFFYDSKNDQELQKIQSLYREVSEVIYDLGGFFSRPYGLWKEIVFSRHKMYADTLKKTKLIFDPQNIMHPGHFF